MAAIQFMRQQISGKHKRTSARVDEKKLLLREGRKIVEALGKTFAPYCEVVLHDLTRPSNAIVAIENNLSGRAVGDATTEIGLARVADPAMPDLLVNYRNTTTLGENFKSTSIGIRDSSGLFVAAICINMDVSLFRSVIGVLERVIQTEDTNIGIKENITARQDKDIESFINDYAATRNCTPKALSGTELRDLIVEMQRSGYMEIRGSAARISAMIGISRTSIYHYLKDPVK